MTIKSKKAASVLGVVVLSMALALLICTSLLPKPMLHGDYPYYPDVESITSAADVIVVGEVVTARNVKKLMVDKTSNKTACICIFFFSLYDWWFHCIINIG